MQFPIITALSLVASAVAVPAPVSMNMLRLKEAIATNYTWTVSSWNTDGCAGASTSGCTYSRSTASLPTELYINIYNQITESVGIYRKPCNNG